MECAMRLFTLLFAISLLISGTSMAQPQPIVTNQQINFWDAVIAGDVTSAVALIKTGADVNGLDTRPVAGPNGRRPLNYAAIRNDTAMITALQIATVTDHADILKILRQAVTPAQ